jgi:hypothetical protein
MIVLVVHMDSLTQFGQFVFQVVESFHSCASVTVGITVGGFDFFLFL